MLAVVSSPATSSTKHVAGDVAVVDAAAGVVGGDDHRLEQVARAARRSGSARRRSPRLGDEAVDRRLHLAHAAVERRSRRQRQVAPVGKRRAASAATSAGKDQVQVALDDVVVRLERVHVGAEGQPGDGVDRVAHQVGLQVDGRAGRGRLAPALAQPPRDRLRATERRP